jgi:hypothetical protein
MSLLGKRPTKLLVLMLTGAALACAALLLAGSAPANAAPKEPLIITDVSPEPGATNVPVDIGNAEGGVVATFNHELHTTDVRPNMHLTNVETGEDVRRPLCYIPDPDATKLIIPLNTDNRCGFPDTTPLECDTTYEVSVSGKGRGAVRGFDRGKLSGVPAGVTFEKRIASWTFTTVPC